jgi:hypothetical protein
MHKKASDSALTVKQLAPAHVHTSCRTQVQPGAVDRWPKSWDDQPALAVKHVAPASVHITTQIQNTFAMTNMWPDSWA